MKVRLGETAEERRATIYELYNDGREFRIFAIALIVIGMIMAVIFYGTNYYNSDVAVNKGNPYNCITCKNAGRACSKHTNFDTETAFRDKVYFVCERYTAEDDEEHKLYDVYGYGNVYNTECDFCNKQESECYSCKQDRLSIFEAVDTVINNDEYTSELCADCKELGYANCTKCRDMLKYKVYTNIKE